MINLSCAACRNEREKLHGSTALAAALALRFIPPGCDKANYRAAAPRPRADALPPSACALRADGYRYIDNHGPGLRRRKNNIVGESGRTSPQVVQLTHSRTISSPLGFSRGLPDTGPYPSSSQSPQKQIPHASHLSPLTLAPIDTPIRHLRNSDMYLPIILQYPTKFRLLRKFDMYDEPTSTKF